MFLFLARQLLGLKKIDDPLFSRRYYLLEVRIFLFSLTIHLMTVLELEYGSIIHSSCQSRR